MKLFYTLLFCIASLIQGHCAFQSVTLAWDANTEEDIDSYIIYYGIENGIYLYSTNVGNVTTATIGGLQEGLTYYFEITAKSTAGFESGISNEVTNAIPYLVKSINLIVQESLNARGPWTNIWNIERLVNATTCVYRVMVRLPDATNGVSSINANGDNIEDLPPLPPGFP